MRRVFTKFLGSSWFSDTEAVGVKLEDADGTAAEIAMTTDIVDQVAQGLKIEKAKVHRFQEMGIPSRGPVGEPVHTTAMRVGAIEVRPGGGPDGRPVLVIETELGAEYCFSFPPEFAARLRSLGPQNPE